MPMTRIRSAALALACAAAVFPIASALAQPLPRAVAPSPREPRLANLRQLTDGGENAEAYFSADGRKLIFQATVPGGRPCDEIFTMNVDGSGVRRVSTGTGRTTCGYFHPGRDRVVYASTHAADTACPGYRR